MDKIVFLKINQRESKNNVKTLMENMNELGVLLEINQSRIEKRILDLKRNLHTQCEQGDGSLRHNKHLAKLLLFVVEMKNSLLREAKFDNHINPVKHLISELNDQEIENAIGELESLREINTLHELKLSFEKTIDTIDYNKSVLLRKVISKWLKR